MGNVQIGHLYRKRTVRNLAGQVIEMSDDADGGTIISKGRVVNEARVIELNRIEADKKSAATAFTIVHDAPEEVREQRTLSPSKMKEMEARIEAQDKKLDAILVALAKK